MTDSQSKGSVGWLSFAGRRQCNQDSAGAWSGEGWSVVAVADGVGGSAGGDIASRIAIKTVRSFVAWLKRYGPGLRIDDVRRRFETIFTDANEAIGKADGPSGMGTTLVAAVLVHEHLLVGHVGDSRAYLLTDSGVERLTSDHSYVEEYAAKGQSVPAHMRHAITRSLDGTADSEADFHTRAERNGSPSSPVVESEADGQDEDPDRSEGYDRPCAVLLCSDGASNHLDNEQMLEALQSTDGPSAAAKSLVCTAYDAGSDDNISVAIAEVGQMPRVAAPLSAAAFKLPDLGPADARSVWTTGKCVLLFAILLTLVALGLVGIRFADVLLENRATPPTLPPDAPAPPDPIDDADAVQQNVTDTDGKTGNQGMGIIPPTSDQDGVGRQSLPTGDGKVWPDQQQLEQDGGTGTPFVPGMDVNPTSQVKPLTLSMILDGSAVELGKGVSIDLGDCEQRMSKQVTFVLRNDNASAIDITLEVSGDYSLTGEPPTAVAANSQVEFTLELTMKPVGEKGGQLHIKSGASNMLYPLVHRVLPSQHDETDLNAAQGEEG